MIYEASLWSSYLTGGFSIQIIMTSHECHGVSNPLVTCGFPSQRARNMESFAWHNAIIWKVFLGLQIHHSGGIRLTLFTSLWPSDAIWQQRSGLTLAQVMTCWLRASGHYLNQYFGVRQSAKWVRPSLFFFFFSLPESMLTYHQWCYVALN